MSKNDQNGRQPQIQTAAPNEIRIRNSNTSDTQDGICRDFVWGICSKGIQCKYRHELKLESMKNILRFCHDFQNRSGCKRPGCTYLHTTNEEENLFLRTGQIPRVLRERYASMSVSLPSNMYLDQVLMQPPPPPPLGALPPAGAPPLPPSSPLPNLLTTQPPPPPTVTTTLQMSPHLTAPLPVDPSSTLSANQPSLLQMFDPSKPPPPLTSAPKNGALKRSIETTEAGSNKARKQDVSKVENSLCESCVQRKLRVDILNKKMHAVECEKKCQTFLFEKKTEAFDNGKLLLKSAVSPELYRILDEYIESPPQAPPASDTLSQLKQMSSVVKGSSSLQKQVLMNMMELAKNIMETGPGTSVFGNGSELTIQFLEMMRNAKNDSQKSSNLVNGFGPINGKVNCSSPTTASTSNKYITTANTTRTSTAGPVPSVATNASTNGCAGPGKIPEISVLNSQNSPQKHLPRQTKEHSQGLTPAHTQGLVQPNPPKLTQVHPQNLPQMNPQSVANVQPQTQKSPHKQKNKTHPPNGAHNAKLTHTTITHIQKATSSQNALLSKNLLRSRKIINSQNTTHSQTVTIPQSVAPKQNVKHLRGVPNSQNGTLETSQPITYVPYQTAAPLPLKSSYPASQQQPPATKNVSTTPYAPVSATTTAVKPSTPATIPNNTPSKSVTRYSSPHYHPPFK